MTKLKWLLSAGRIEAIQAGAEIINPARYNSFVEVFGERNIGLVSMDKLLEEVRTGVPSPVYLLGRNLNVNLSCERGVQSNLFLASGFDIGNELPVRRGDLEMVMDYLDLESKKGNVGTIVNSRDSTLFEDKISFVELSKKWDSVPTTYHFSDREQLNDFIKRNGEYVVKHRFGSNGLDNFLIDTSNLGLLDDRDVSDYIVQEVLLIVSETRMIFYRDDFLGARRIVDRIKPWEVNQDLKREHKIERYSPNAREIKMGRSLFRYAGAVVGAVDMVTLEDGSEKFLEFNGVGTGFGYPGGVYDLNLELAQRLKDDFVAK